MNIEQELFKLKKSIEDLERREAKAKWELDQVEKEAKALGLKSAKMAEKEAKLAAKKAEALEKELEKELATVQEEFGELLELARG